MLLFICALSLAGAIWLSSFVFKAKGPVAKIGLLGVGRPVTHQ